MRNLLKKSKTIISAIVAGVFITAIGVLIAPKSNASVNPDCPNGCLDRCGNCFCYKHYYLKEANWDKEELKPEFTL